MLSFFPLGDMAKGDPCPHCEVACRRALDHQVIAGPADLDGVWRNWRTLKIACHVCAPTREEIAEAERLALAR